MQSYISLISTSNEYILGPDENSQNEFRMQTSTSTTVSDESRMKTDCLEKYSDNRWWFYYSQRLA